MISVKQIEFIGGYMVSTEHSYDKSPFYKGFLESKENQNVTPEEVYQQYKRNLDSGQSNNEIIEQILPKKSSSTEDRALVAAKLLKLKDDQKAFEKYYERLLRARLYLGSISANLEAISDLKSRILSSELQPGKVTPESLSQEAKQQLRAFGYVDEEHGIHDGYNINRANSPFSIEFGLGVNENVAFEIAENAKNDPNFHFVKSPRSQDRNAVMDSVSIVKAEAMVAQAAYEAALRGEDLSEFKKRQILNAHRKSTGFWRNAAEYAGYSLFKAVKKVTPGIFGKDHEEDSRYKKYLELRSSFIASHAHFLNSENMRRYLSALRAQKQELINSGIITPFDTREIDELIADAEKKVEEINKEDHKKLAETLDGLNNESLKSVKDLSDEEVAMWKFRILQIILTASPFGFLNIIGPVADILGPTLSGNLQFGEGLAQGMKNIPFFGKIIDFLEIDKVAEFVFDDIPLIGDVTGALNTITDSDFAQEIFGATSPMVQGSPFVLLAVAGVFNIYRVEAEISHKGKSDDAERSHEKKLEDVFKKFRQGFSKDKVEEAIKGTIEKQFIVAEKAFEKKYLLEFIAKAAAENQEHLEIFEGFKIKFKESEDAPEEKVTLKELLQRNYNLSDLQNVFFALRECDASEVDKMIDAIFAFESVDKNLPHFAKLTDEEKKNKAASPRKELTQKELVRYVEEKFSLKVIGQSLEEKRKNALNTLVSNEMSRWRSASTVSPSPGNSPEPENANSLADIMRGFGLNRG